MEPKPFVSHDVSLKFAMRGIPTNRPLGIDVYETEEITRVHAESKNDDCNGAWMRKAYRMCVEHRREQHGDESCFVAYRHQAGVCTYP